MAEHTPTPWRVLYGVNVTSTDRVIALCAVVAGGANAAEEPLINAANAAFIVRAVNAHDDLLAACEAALGYIVDGCGNLRPVGALRAAIAKAKGGDPDRQG